MNCQRILDNTGHHQEKIDLIMVKSNSLLEKTNRGVDKSNSHLETMNRVVNKSNPHPDKNNFLISLSDRKLDVNARDNVKNESEMKTILFEADSYMRNSIVQPMVLEKVKPINYDEETLAE